MSQLNFHKPTDNLKNKKYFNSFKDFFFQYPQTAINVNKCFVDKKFLIPKLPIQNNIIKISEKKINISPILQEINNYTAQWSNKDKYSNKWSSITLKSCDGKDQDFLEKHYFGINEENTFKYTENIKFFPYIKFLLDTMKNEIYLVRLLKLDKGGIIKYHSDGMVFNNEKNIIRLHLPLITNKDNIFKIGYALAPPAPGYSIWKADTLYSTSLDAGFFYYTNVNTLHSVENNSDIDRIHLVLDIKPTSEILKKLNII